MEFHIENVDRSIRASFKFKLERDLCIDMLRERYPDATFYAVDDKEE